MMDHQLLNYTRVRIEFKQSSGGCVTKTSDRGCVLNEGMPAETTTAICCMIFGGVLEKFPKLRVCFAHGGNHFTNRLTLVINSLH